MNSNADQITELNTEVVSHFFSPLLFNKPVVANKVFLVLASYLPSAERDVASPTAASSSSGGRGGGSPPALDRHHASSSPPSPTTLTTRKHKMQLGLDWVRRMEIKIMCVSQTERTPPAPFAARLPNPPQQLSVLPRQWPSAWCHGPDGVPAGRRSQP